MFLSFFSPISFCWCFVVFLPLRAFFLPVLSFGCASLLCFFFLLLCSFAGLGFLSFPWVFLCSWPRWPPLFFIGSSLLFSFVVFAFFASFFLSLFIVVSAFLSLFLSFLPVFFVPCSILFCWSFVLLFCCPLPFAVLVPFLVLFVCLCFCLFFLFLCRFSRLLFSAFFLSRFCPILGFSCLLRACVLVFAFRCARFVALVFLVAFALFASWGFVFCSFALPFLSFFRSSVPFPLSCLLFVVLCGLLFGSLACSAGPCSFSFSRCAFFLLFVQCVLLWFGVPALSRLWDVLLGSLFVV